MKKEKENLKLNPFYNNYVFSRADLNRFKIKWWQYPLLWFLPTYIQVNEGFVFYFKYWQGKVFLVKVEELEKYKSNSK